MRRPEHITNCFRPLRIGDKLVPCGCCDACLRMQASRNVDAITGFAQDHPNLDVLFITLTYSNENLPLGELSFESVDKDLHTFAPLYDQVLDDRFNESAKLKVLTFRMDTAKCNRSVGHSYHVYGDDFKSVKVGVLNKRDLQLYFKNIRQDLFELGYEKAKFYHYTVGEYGPKHFRPHYHSIVFCEKRITDKLRELLVSSWSLGFTNLQRATISVSEYCAKYISSTASLPNYLRRSFARPFKIHSVGMYKKLSSEDIALIRGFNFDTTLSYTRRTDDKLVSCLYSMPYLRSFFPKPYRYDRKELGKAYNSLCLYRRLKKLLNCKTVVGIADLIYKDIYPDDFEFVKSNDFTTRSPIFDIDRLFYWEHVLNVYSELFLDYDRFCRELYKSKHFMMNTVALGICENEYFDLIVGYYDKLDSESLSHFYRDQELLGIYYADDHEDYVRALAGMYINSGLFESSSFDDSSINLNSTAFPFWEDFGISPPCLNPNSPSSIREKSYREFITRQLHEDVKHKLLNDINRHFLELDTL